MSDKPLMTQTLNLIDNFIRRTTMMTIKDLSASKELDRKALAEVRGGQEINVIGIEALNQLVLGGGGIGSPTIGIQVAPLINVVTGVEQHLPSLFPVPA
jgi:hypothetical protein